jgi:hypothetical protein
VSGTPSLSLNGASITASGSTWADHFPIHKIPSQNTNAHPTNKYWSSFISILIGALIEVLRRETGTNNVLVTISQSFAVVRKMLEPQVGILPVRAGWRPALFWLRLCLIDDPSRHYRPIHP